MELDSKDRRIILEAERLFERAAQSWVRGNNSGDPRRLEYGERACDRLRKEAERLIACTWPGITIDYPGLYPAYKVQGWNAYELQDAVKLTLARPRDTGCPHCGRTDSHSHQFGMDGREF